MDAVEGGQVGVEATSLEPSPMNTKLNEMKNKHGVFTTEIIGTETKISLYIEGSNPCWTQAISDYIHAYRYTQPTF